MCIPRHQQSWVSKAHAVRTPVRASFYDPDAADPAAAISARPAHARCFALLDGPPASCVNIALHHLQGDDRPPFDLVISGPNFGRNSGTIFTTASGTIGAAIEGALCGRRAIALSFAFYREIGYDDQCALYVWRAAALFYAPQ